MYQIIICFSYIILHILRVDAVDKELIMKNQYCTDPRTNKKHAAYTEWTDAYSCTRHRCQPGGRDLAIFTVGCKRVEAPESAIQCEEVVEDTNIQFPYCCTRLRCLVVVRGEVWTRVIGQPWEILPAAPWSHMYKKKKPPPPSTGFFTNTRDDKKPLSQRSAPEVPGSHASEDIPKSAFTDETKVRSEPPCNGHHDNRPPLLGSPDIVIALATGDEDGEIKKRVDETKTEKPEKIPESKEELNKLEKEAEDKNDVPVVKAQETPSETEDKTDFNLQSLVDAIGFRMRDIEDVVQKMSQKVEEGKKSVIRYDDQENDDNKDKQEEPTTESPTEEGTISYYHDPSNVIRQQSLKEPTQYIAPIEEHHHKSAEKKRRRRKKNHSSHKSKKDGKKKHGDGKLLNNIAFSVEDFDSNK